MRHVVRELDLVSIFIRYRFFVLLFGIHLLTKSKIKEETKRLLSTKVLNGPWRQSIYNQSFSNSPLRQRDLVYSQTRRPRFSFRKRNTSVKYHPLRSISEDMNFLKCQDALFPATTSQTRNYQPNQTSQSPTK